MKIKLKKVLSLLLVLMLILQIPVFFTSAKDSDSDYVARMYLCARVKSAGHVWLYFENLTDGKIQVGCCEVPKGKGISVGTFKLTRKDGKGIYYNVEAYCGNKYGLSGTKVISTLITADQLSSVNKKILSSNNWTLFKNCCKFAVPIWNSVAKKQIKNSIFPSTIKSRIKKAADGSVLNMCVPTADNVYKQHGSGASAYVKPVSSGSLKKKVG